MTDSPLKLVIKEVYSYVKEKSRPPSELVKSLLSKGFQEGEIKEAMTYLLHENFIDLSTDRFLRIPPEHHVWCNFFMRPIEGCKMCERLWKEYPYNTNSDISELMAKNFPDAKVLS